MKHLKLFETFEIPDGSVKDSVLKKLGVSEDDIWEVKSICADIAMEVGDKGTCVIGGGLLANGKTIISAYSQGNTGPERCYTEVKKYLAPKYPNIKFEIEWGNMD